MGKKVLLIDDDLELGSLVETILRPVGINVYHAHSGSEGLKKTYEVQPDLVILDIMMPGMNGFDVCTRLREMATIPILMLTACSSEKQMLHSFEVGADDFITKPFNHKEIEARVLALLRRMQRLNKASLTYIQSYNDSIVEIDLNSQVVKLRGTPIDLSPTEYNVLACLVRESGKIISQSELAKEVWGQPISCNLASVPLYVFYLRKKLEDGQHGHQYIHTLWKRGYRFDQMNIE